MESQRRVGELTKRQFVVAIVIVGWVVSFGGIAYTEYQENRVIPSAGHLLGTAVVAVFLGVALAGLAYWKARRYF